MRKLATLIAVVALPLSAATLQAAPAQDCIVEGTVKNKTSETHGTNVYVAFHSATSASDGVDCELVKQGKVQFKEPKNALIENIPAGSRVQYHYTEEEGGDSQWRLMKVSVE